MNKKRGLPLPIALEMHNRKHPTDDKQIMGNLIRSGGHCGCPSPDEYGADPVYDKNNNKLTVKRYVGSYHIDDQIGLNVLAEVLKKLTIEELSK